jgi:hypothetical protein
LHPLVLPVGQAFLFSAPGFQLFLLVNLCFRLFLGEFTQHFQGKKATTTKPYSISEVDQPPLRLRFDGIKVPVDTVTHDSG